MQISLKIAAITAVTLLATGCNLMKGKETTGQYVDDATVSTRAKAALVKDSTSRRVISTSTSTRAT